MYACAFGSLRHGENAKNGQKCAAERAQRRTQKPRSRTYHESQQTILMNIANEFKLFIVFPLCGRHSVHMRARARLAHSNLRNLLAAFVHLSRARRPFFARSVSFRCVSNASLYTMKNCIVCPRRACNLSQLSPSTTVCQRRVSSPY